MRLKKIFIIPVLFLCASCVRSPENFFFGNYSQAEVLFQKGEYERAIQKYQAYIDENPEGNLAVISYYYIAKSHLALGHSEEAKNLFTKIVQEYPDVAWANFSQTQLKSLESQGDMSELPAPEAEAAAKDQSLQVLASDKDASHEWRFLKQP